MSKEMGEQPSMRTLKSSSELTSSGGSFVTVNAPLSKQTFHASHKHSCMQQSSRLQHHNVRTTTRAETLTHLQQHVTFPQ